MRIGVSLNKPENTEGEIGLLEIREEAVKIREAKWHRLLESDFGDLWPCNKQP